MDTHFFAGLTKFKLDAGKHRRDDDFADRFSHNFTTLLLVIFTLVVSARQYIGKPIACWVPTEFTRAQEEYAESVCWVTSTYFLPTRQKTVPESTAEREERKLLYYQWVPFVLMIQAFLFNFPCIIWRLFNWQSGIHLSSIMEVSCDIEMIRDPESRKSNISYVARHIEDALTSQREYRGGCTIGFRHFLARSCCLWFGKRYGNYLICLYLITKALYIFNVVGQFFLMNRILGTNYTFYGLDLLRDIAEGHLWEESGNFPRITMCDFEIRKLANKHRYTVQCVLPINMFNEKIFIFLWFWFILVAAVATSSFLYWSYKSSFRNNRIHFIRKFLKLREALSPGEKKRSFTFVDNYLRQDGVFILRLVAQNAGELVASEIVEKLWQMFKRRQDVGLAKSPEKHAPPDPVGWNLPINNKQKSASSHSCHSHATKRENRGMQSEVGSTLGQHSAYPVQGVSSPQVSVLGKPVDGHQHKHHFTLGLPPPPVPKSLSSAPPPLPPPPGSCIPSGGNDGGGGSGSIGSHSSTTKSSDHLINSRASKGNKRGSDSLSKEDKLSLQSSSSEFRPSAPSGETVSRINQTVANRSAISRLRLNANSAIEEDPGEFV
ncbi:hypothetical protein AAHC03_016693 [Spirometra sp. Aus1]